MTSLTISEIKELLETAKENGKIYDFEINLLHDFKYSKTFEIGISYKGNVYHWAEHNTYFPTERNPLIECFCSMTHSYSRNTGQIKKGFKYTLYKSISINKKLGAEIF